MRFYMSCAGAFRAVANIKNQTVRSFFRKKKNAGSRYFISSIGKTFKVTFVKIISSNFVFEPRINQQKMHKSGFVNIIGNPNVGKSTLMNAFVGERLSIITSKAQTTRHRIMGVVSGDDFQIVFSDTPGILKPSYKLQESMMKFVTGALTDADVILYVTDTVEQGDRSAEIVGSIRGSGIPTIVVINKIDLSTPEALDALVDKWRATIPGTRRSSPSSAKEKFQHRRAVRPDPLAAARRSGVLPQRDADGQDAALLRIGDHPREDPQLRQGDPLLLRNRDRQLQGGADDRPHRRDDLRGPRLAERHTDRPQGRETLKTEWDRPHARIWSSSSARRSSSSSSSRSATTGATTNASCAVSDTNRNK